MTDTAAENITKSDAGPGFCAAAVAQVGPGSRLTAPDGSVAEISAVRWEQDDYGNPSVAVLERRGGKPIRVSAGATVQLRGPTCRAGRRPRTR